MKTQIHELRTRIDGLAQLVKSLNENGKINNVNQNSPISNMYISVIANEIIDMVNLAINQSLFQNTNLYEASKSLLLAKAWLGKVLAELGEETPYKNDGNRKTVEDIEPTADKSTLTEVYYKMNAQFNVKTLFNDENNVIGESSRSYIEKIDWLREEIEKCIKLSFGSPEADKCLTEARFFLGFELQNIKEQSK